MRLSTVKHLITAGLLGLSAQAFPATFSTIGDTVTVDYTGSGGLTATTIYELTAIGDAGASWTFSGSLENTSSFGSRISIAGFNTSGLLDILGSSATGGFSNVASGQLPGGGTLDYCLKNSIGENCTGGGGDGALDGDGPLLFEFTIHMNSPLEELELTDYTVRYQSLTKPVPVVAFASMEVFTPAPVPLPASAWLFLSALGGLGAARARRNQAAHTAQA